MPIATRAGGSRCSFDRVHLRRDASLAAYVWSGQTLEAGNRCGSTRHGAATSAQIVERVGIVLKNLAHQVGFSKMTFDLQRAHRGTNDDGDGFVPAQQTRHRATESFFEWFVITQLAFAPIQAKTFSVTTQAIEDEVDGVHVPFHRRNIGIVER